MRVRSRAEGSGRTGVGGLVLGVACLIALLAPACGDDDDVSGAATTSTPATPLEGTNWALTPGAALGVDLGDIAVTAVFADGTLSGQSGCNSYTTSYTVDGSSLTIGPDIAGTRMACPPPETAVETAYLGLLPGVASYEIVASTLTLADDEGEALLEYSAVIGADAIVGQWTVISYYSGDAITSVVGGVDLTTEFGAQEVTGNAGCNTFSGPYTVDGSAIEIGPIASTLKACPTEELGKQESDYLAALELAETFTVTGTRLDLFRSGGTFAATLERA